MRGASTTTGMLALIGLSIMATACSPGGSSGRAPASTTSPPGGLAAAYLAIANNEGAGADAFHGQLSQLGSDPSAPQVAAVGVPMANVLARADQQLLQLPWPPRLRTSVDAVVRADGTVEDDLRSPGIPAPFSLASWQQRLSSDAGAEHAAVTTLRRALGLAQAQPA